MFHHHNRRIWTVRRSYLAPSQGGVYYQYSFFTLLAKLVFFLETSKSIREIRWNPSKPPLSTISIYLFTSFTIQLFIDLMLHLQGVSSELYSRVLLGSSLDDRQHPHFLNKRIWQLECYINLEFITTGLRSSRLTFIAHNIHTLLFILLYYRKDNHRLSSGQINN